MNGILDFITTVVVAAGGELPLQFGCASSLAKNGLTPSSKSALLAPAIVALRRSLGPARARHALKLGVTRSHDGLQARGRARG